MKIGIYWRLPNGEDVVARNMPEGGETPEA